MAGLPPELLNRIIDDSEGVIQESARSAVMGAERQDPNWANEELIMAAGYAQRVTRLRRDEMQEHVDKMHEEHGHELRTVMLEDAALDQLRQTVSHWCATSYFIYKEEPPVHLGQDKDSREVSPVALAFKLIDHVGFTSPYDRATAACQLEAIFMATDHGAMDEALYNARPLLG